MSHEPSPSGTGPEPIAVIGVGLRLPGGVRDVDSLWHVLIDGVDTVAPIDRDGFDLDALYSPEPRTPGRMATRWGGSLEDLESFDPAFFGISPREAAKISPEQRLLLECTWEAFEDATLDPHRFDGRPVGVYVGQWVSDYEERAFADRSTTDFHAASGSGRYGASGRLSYAFGLMGPSMTIDTACSSSLVAVHLACQSLRSGESELAVAAGVNVILEPNITIAYSQNGMMSTTGQCRFGDAAGDGYVRSEGAAVALLKPLSAALRDGDPIRGLVRGSAVNNDGRTSGVMARPSRVGQADMLRRAYASAGVAPAAVGYVEAHGTGTRAGDPVEVGALADVIGADRSTGERCFVGSAKTNFGHTEGAAGIVGVIKCLLTMEHGTIPPSLHFDVPNPAIPWGDLPFDVPAEPTPWPRSEGTPRIAGVSGYGISATNAHVVLEEPPHQARVVAARGSAGEPLPLPISAASEPGLRASAGLLADLLDSPAATGWTLTDVCASAARHRAELPHRAVVVASSIAEAAAGLRAVAAGDDSAVAARGQAGAVARRVAFVFPGQGGQWDGMARELLATESAFAATIDACDAAMPSGAGFSVREQLTLDATDARRRLGEISVLQPTLLAVEIALASTWRALGVEPVAAVGHSMGEIGAAHIAGALTLADAMHIVCARSALMQRTSGQGAMALLDAPAADVEARLAGTADRVGVAAVNSPRSTIISGAPEAVAGIVSAAERDGMFARRVQVDVASHSPQMQPLVAELVAGVDHIAPALTTLDLYSTVTSRLVDGPTLDARHWGANLRQPVLFGPTVAQMIDAGIDTFVEVGPHPTLLASIAEVAERADVVPIGSLRRDAPAVVTLLGALGSAWCRGVSVDWSARFPDGEHQRLRLGHYPWQRERYWIPAVARLASGEARASQRLPDELAAHLHELGWELIDAPVGVGGGGNWLLVGTATWMPELAAALASAGAAVTAIADVAAAAVELQRVATGEAPTMVVAVEAFDAAGLAESFRTLLQAWPADIAATPRIWWATAGARSPGSGADAPAAVDQAACWGAARVIGQEHPGWWGGLVDVTTDTPRESDTGLGQQVARAVTTDGEDQLAVSRSSLWALRLVPATPPDPGPAPWRRDAAYLITGGLGGVGLELAREMIGGGARRLVLLGRTALPPRSEWATVEASSPTGRRIAAVRELEALGAAIHLLAADVADESQLAGALQSYADEGWPPIAGVVHAAGVLEPKLVDHADAAAFAAGTASKLGGAMLLDRLLPDVDVFVMMSSTAAFWGTPGLAAYAASNAGLDAVARQRRARGQHALTIAWGPWAGVGMHDSRLDARAASDLHGEGVNELAAHDARRIFAALVAGAGSPTVVVLDLDCARLSSGSRGTWALVRHMVDGHAGVPADGSGVAAALGAASPPDRVAILDDIVRAAIGAVLRVTPAQIDGRRALGTLGLDSLLALELRNRLSAAVAIQLPATLAWNYPTVDALVGHLASLLATATTPATDDGAVGGGASVEPAGDDVLANMLGDLAQLTEHDAASALRGGRR